MAPVGDHWRVLADAVEAADVVIQLRLLLKQVLHQGAMAAVRVEASEQQLGVGAQGRQRIAELMHQQMQLLPLGFELVEQAPAFQVKAQALGQGCGTGLKAPVQAWVPVVVGMAFGP